MGKLIFGGRVQKRQPCGVLWRSRTPPPTSNQRQCLQARRIHFHFPTSSCPISLLPRVPSSLDSHSSPPCHSPTGTQCPTPSPHASPPSAPPTPSSPPPPRSSTTASMISPVWRRCCRPPVYVPFPSAPPPPCLCLLLYILLGDPCFARWLATVHPARWLLLGSLARADALASTSTSSPTSPSNTHNPNSSPT